MKKRKKGSVLIFVLVLLLSMLMIAVGWANYSTRVFKATVDQEAEERAFEIAEGGIDFVLSLYRAGYAPSQIVGGSIAQPLGGGMFQIQSGGTGITSMGWFGNQCQRVSATASSYSGALGGPFYYRTGFTHDLFDGPCPPVPEATFAVGDPLFADDFEGDCRLGQDSTPEIGEGWNLLDWNNTDGAPLFECEAGGLSLICLGGEGSGDTGVILQAVGDDDCGDCIASAQQQNGSSTNIIATHIQDPENYYSLEWDYDGGSIIKTTSAGGWSAVASFSGPIPDGATVSLMTIGNEIRALVDGIEYASYTDDSPIPAGGTGMGMGDMHDGECSPDGLLDDFNVVDV